MEVGEIAAPPARDADLLPELGGMIEEQNAPASLTRHGGAHHPRAARADDERVEIETRHRLTVRAELVEARTTSVSRASYRRRHSSRRSPRARRSSARPRNAPARSSCRPTSDKTFRAARE